MATLTIQLPNELERALEQHSEFSRVSKDDVVREALQRYLCVAKLRSLRSTLVHHAQARNVHTDDDVFQIVNSQ